MSKSTILKIINIVFILLAIGLVLWLLNKNSPLVGQLEVNLDLKKDRPMVSRLGPEVRTKLENNYQTILEGPVYFDLRTMPWFKKARIYLIFTQRQSQLEGIGFQTGKGWQYTVQKPVVVASLGDGWQQAVFDFDLSQVYQEKNIRRFLISLLPQSGPGDLKIKSLSIILNQW